VTQEPAGGVAGGSRRHGRRLASLRARTRSQPVERPTRFCYMVQGPACMPPGSRREVELSFRGSAGTAERSLLWLTFREPCQGTRVLFRPNCTWAEGRNILYAEMRRTHKDCAYFIFLDDDVYLRARALSALANRTSGTRHTAVAASGQHHTWTAFERFLSDWQPAVGSVFHDNACPACGRVGHVASLYRIDHALLAVHGEAAEVLLPYNLSVDAPRCFYHPPIFMTAKAAALYPGHILRYEGLDVGKQKHSKHSVQRMCNFTWVYQQLRATLPARYAASVREREHYDQPWGVPLHKNESYLKISGFGRR